MQADMLQKLASEHEVVARPEWSSLRKRVNSSLPLLQLLLKPLQFLFLFLQSEL
jgi:hypothetical protein